MNGWFGRSNGLAGVDEQLLHIWSVCGLDDRFDLISPGLVCFAFSKKKGKEKELVAYLGSYEVVDDDTKISMIVT